MAQTPGQALGQQSPDQAGTAAPDTTQQQEPQWLSAIADETMRAEARKGYMQERDYTQGKQNLAKERETFDTDRKSWDEGKGKVETEAKQYRDWYSQQYQPFYQRLTPHWDDINAVLEGQAKVVRNGQAATPQGAALPEGQNGQANIPQDYWNNYDMLTPQEQAVRQQQAMVQYALQPAIQQQQQAIQQQQQALQQAINQQFTERDKIYMDVLQKTRENPDLPLTTYLENLYKVRNGGMDPNEMAYSVTMAETDKKKLEEDAYKRGRADQEQEFKNQQQTPGALGQGTPQVFIKPPSRTKGAIEADMQNVAAKANIPWFTR